jgi:hypothetical protein
MFQAEKKFKTIYDIKNNYILEKLRKNPKISTSNIIKKEKSLISEYTTSFFDIIFKPNYQMKEDETYGENLKLINNIIEKSNYLITAEKTKNSRGNYLIEYPEKNVYNHVIISLLENRSFYPLTEEKLTVDILLQIYEYSNQKWSCPE